MMRLVCFGMAVLILAGTIRADEPKPDYKKLYDDTRQQLQAAQDRKVQLAARVAELEKKLQDQTAELDELKRQAFVYADKTYLLRTYYAAWQQFMLDHPAIKLQWDFFLANVSPLPTTQPTPFTDSNWPLPAQP